MEEKGLLGLAFNGDDGHHRPAGAASQVSPELFKQGVIEHAVWLGAFDSSTVGCPVVLAEGPGCDLLPPGSFLGLLRCPYQLTPRFPLAD